MRRPGVRRPIVGSRKSLQMALMFFGMAKKELTQSSQSTQRSQSGNRRGNSFRVYSGRASRTPGQGERTKAGGEREVDRLPSWGAACCAPTRENEPGRATRKKQKGKLCEPQLALQVSYHIGSLLQDLFLSEEKPCVFPNAAAGCTLPCICPQGSLSANQFKTPHVPRQVKTRLR